MGKLPVSDYGNLYILDVVDHVSKWVELFALHRIQAEDVDMSNGDYLLPRFTRIHLIRSR